MTTYSVEEWYAISHVILPPDMDWDPSFLNSTESEHYEWFENMVSGLVSNDMFYTS